MARSRKPALVLDIDEASGLSVNEQIRNALTEQVCLIAASAARTASVHHAWRRRSIAAMCVREPIRKSCAHAHRHSHRHAHRHSASFWALTPPLTPHGDLSGGAARGRPLQAILCPHRPFQAIKVLDLFLEWDADHSGEVTKGEFRNEMSKLGLETHQTEVDALFDSWDPDRSGSLELKELERVLRRTTMLDKKLCAGAVELQLKKGNSKSLRASAADMSSFSSCFDLDEASDEPFAVQLHRMLQDTSRDQGGRLADLFREWDTDESGQLSKPEFRLAMRKISYALPSEDIDHVFDSMDPDRSGTNLYSLYCIYCTYLFYGR